MKMFSDGWAIGVDALDGETGRSLCDVVASGGRDSQRGRRVDEGEEEFTLVRVDAVRRLRDGSAVAVLSDMSGSVRAAVDAHVVREPEFREDVAVLLKGVRTFDMGGDGNLVYADNADAVHVVLTPRNVVQIFTTASSPSSSTSPSTWKTVAGSAAVGRRRRRMPHEMVGEGRKRQRAFAAITNGEKDDNENIIVINNNNNNNDNNNNLERRRRREEEEQEDDRRRRTTTTNAAADVPIRTTAGPPTASMSSPSRNTRSGPLCLRDANATNVKGSNQDRADCHADDAELEALLRGLENEGGENFGV